MNSKLNNYFSPIKILLLLFSLLLTIQLALNYFSSSPISIIRFNKYNNVLDTGKNYKNSVNSIEVHKGDSHQLDYYDNNSNEWIYTKDSTNNSILFCINRNCNHCINVQLIKNHNLRHCPKPLSILNKEAYCQYLHMNLINEYTFSTILSSVISLVSSQFNIKDSKNFLPSHFKCFSIRKQVSGSGTSNHTQKLSKPKSEPSKAIIKKSTSKYDIRRRYHNYNYFYNYIHEVYEFFGNRLNNVTIYTSKNLVCINTKSKLNLGKAKKSKSSIVNINEKTRKDYSYIITAKDQKITFRNNDLPWNYINGQKKKQSFLGLLFTNGYRHTFLSFIMILSKGMAIFYILTLIKVSIFYFIWYN